MDNGIGERDETPQRRKPAISKLREEFLRERLRNPARPEDGIYPFRDTALDRADIEWLLATLGEGSGGKVGSIDWGDTEDQKRPGLDLRATSLSNLDLSGLLLAGTHFENADLTRAVLTNADLRGAHFENAELHHAKLVDANFYQARLDKANLFRADLTRATLVEARLHGTVLREATLKGANLRKANLCGLKVDFEIIKIMRVLDAGFPYILEAADLRGAFFDSATVLDDAIIGDGKTGLAIGDVRFDRVGLGGVDWSRVRMLGDERIARQSSKRKEKEGDKKEREEVYRDAIRANRQLSNALLQEGHNEESSYFMHRARKLERRVYLRKREFGAFIFSALLSALTLDGYKARRLLVWYFGTLFVFAVLYFGYGQVFGPYVMPLNAVYMSAVAFHRLSFASNPLFPTTTLTIISVIESLFGLLIEAGLIAAFTSRLLGR